MMGSRSYSYLVKRVEETILRKGLLDRGDTVIVGLSGGADSVCLLKVLAELRESLDLTLAAFHVHHGLRESADGDLAYCEALCGELNVPIRVYRVDAQASAREWKCSVEEAGRILRKQSAEACLAEWPGAKIALAHHLEDRAETFLLNAARGSALTGLRSILPASEGIVRPLIEVSRAEIEAYLAETKTPYRTDETNASDAYTRNRIRHDILPLLKEEVNDRAAEHLCAAAEEIAAAERYLAAVTQETLREVTDAEGCIDGNLLLQKDSYLQGRVLYEALAAACGRKKDLTAEHVDALRDILTKGGSHRLALPCGVTAVCAYGKLSFAETAAPTIEKNDYEARVFARPEPCVVPRGEYTKWFDYDKITSVFSLRTRQQGDVITLAPGRRKSLARFMIDEKIPADVRDAMVLPASGNEILWIPGHRISAAYPVDENTKMILELTYKPRK